jgi:hypothetical protein
LSQDRRMARVAAERIVSASRENSMTEDTLTRSVHETFTRLL